MTELSNDIKNQLNSFRQSIDNIDASLVFMLAERFKITKQVGFYKKEHALPPADPAREQEQIDRLKALAKSADLDPDFSEKFLHFIIKEVIRHHEQIRDGEMVD
ncbi:chorismate mutase [Temperatibacter marinus]|uniref:chorismate mutase n=1 Tax=Temperatibacter marinus TaxID=1456591 RepID=A0AA52EJN8_9PROT|nr:chorismate mutase [Temperatibacter marinus]WND03266.1 chorismate mutase [Temperatibacter marinus]